jgi:60 kDa SS-A/Ro ribonucleoprotein
MGPQALRMNLNTLLRHGVFEDREMVEYVAGRLTDADEVRRSRQFPYQYLAAYLNAAEGVPEEIRLGLEAAAEIACGNVPALRGPVVVGLDVSGSMGSVITGRGRGMASKMRCVDVAALFAAAVVRSNPGSVIVPFDTNAYQVTIEPGWTILDLARRLAQYGGGGTDCSLPMAHACTALADRTFAGCVLVSDYESWVGNGRYGSTAVMIQWERFLAQQAALGNRGSLAPKLVCINLQPYTTVQAPERDDILNVGGFSDAVFEVIAGFLRDDGSTFVREVEAIEV